MPRLRDVISSLQTIAPESLAESWDKVGLHVGSPDATVRSALICIDLTEAVIGEAVRQKVDLVIAYHPPIFAPVQTLTTETWKGRVLLEAVRNNIAVYSPHTALDAAEGGVNDWLASGVGVGDVEPITATRLSTTAPYKVVTFVPPADVAVVRSAMSKAGAGHIGDYRECSFATYGQGSFLGGETTNPTVGQRGKLELVDELRLEMICPSNRLAAVLAAHRDAHPYEEPAVDVYQLVDVPEEQPQTGQGRLVRLKKPISSATLVERVRGHLGLKHVKCAKSARSGKIRTVGVCAGAGGSLLEEAGDVDAFVTGEMRHHDVLDATANGVTIVLAGHTQTERPYLPVYKKQITKLMGKSLAVSVSKADKAPAVVV